MKIELLHKDKKSKTLPFPANLFIVRLPLPINYRDRDLRIDVLSPKGNVIYSAPVQKKQKQKKKTKTENGIKLP